jgi:uncharacterized protein
MLLLFSLFSYKHFAMKLIVFGATGMVGQQLVQQALWKGHTVKAFGRNVFTAGLPEDEKLELVKGALFDEKEVYEAVKDCDAVLSVLGGAVDGADKTRSLGIKNIIKQMSKAGVKRIVAIGGLGVLQQDEETMLLEDENYPEEYLAVGKEHLYAYHALNESGLQWTFVCPPNILNETATGHFITNANYAPQPNSMKIAAGDLALFMLAELEKNEFVNTRVGICNT